MASDNTLVETLNGPVRGHDDGHVTAWKGVRYAAPPIGDLRWRAPEPPERWTDVADATRFGQRLPAARRPHGSRSTSAHRRARTASPSMSGRRRIPRPVTASR